MSGSDGVGALILNGWTVLLASTFVVVLFSFVEGGWSAFWSSTWEERFATWGRNLCLIGWGATIEFMVHHEELLSITERYVLTPKTTGIAVLTVSAISVPAVLLILLLLVVPSGLLATIKKQVAPMSRWGGIACVFFGGIVLSLPLVIRDWFAH